MKILFVYSTIECISTKKCCFELATALKKYAITEIINYKLLTNEVAESFDVIIFQRIGDGVRISEEDKINIFNIINKNKKIIFIYLVDDLILENQNGLPKELAKECDAVMCSSDTLCNNFKKYNKKVIRFSTFINTEFYESIKKNNFEKFTVSWISNDGVGIDLINKIINEILNVNLDLNLIAISGQAHNLQKANFIRYYGVISEKSMIEIIKGTDIILNPVTPSGRVNTIVKSIYKADVDEFLNSKAEIKYLTAGMCNSCLLTSNIECYKQTIINGVNGFILSNDISEWISIIEKLYNDRCYLEKIKANSYKDVKEKYDVNKVAEEIYKMLSKIYENN